MCAFFLFFLRACDFCLVGMTHEPPRAPVDHGGFDLLQLVPQSLLPLEQYLLLFGAFLASDRVSVRRLCVAPFGRMPPVDKSWRELSILLLLCL